MPVPASRPSARRKKPDPVSRGPKRAAVTSAARAAALHAAAASQQADTARDQRVGDIAAWQSEIRALIQRLGEIGMLSAAARREALALLDSVILTGSLDDGLNCLFVWASHTHAAFLAAAQRVDSPKAKETLEARGVRLAIEVARVIAQLTTNPEPNAVNRTAQQRESDRAVSATASGVAHPDISKWQPVTTTVGGRVTRKSSEDLRQLRADAPRFGVMQRLTDVLEAKIELADALPKETVNELPALPEISVPRQPLPTNYRYTIQAGNARRLLNYVSRVFVVPDHRRKDAGEWLLRALAQRLKEDAGHAAA